MLEIIFSVILTSSLIGLGIIIFQKLPRLLELPEVAPSSFKWQDLFSKIKNVPPFRGISFEIILQKVLSRIRVLTLKTDSKTSSWLQRLRERERKKKFGENDNYWKEIRKRMR
jgi:hypothetical protein